MRKLIYSVLSKTIFHNGMKRKINSQIINFPVSVYKYYPDQYEQHKFNFLRKWVKPGSTVLDIGAHIGLFTVLLAKMVGGNGKVLSFEPSRENFSLLQETIKLNSLESVCTAFCKAVDEEAGQKNLYLSGNFASNANSLMPLVADKVGGAETIQTINLDADEFRQYDTSAVKIDAEGSEVRIFRGGKAFFKRNMPVCTVEIHPKLIASNGDHLEELIDIATDLGYRFYFNNQPAEKGWLVSQKECFEVQMLPAAFESSGRELPVVDKHP